MNIYLVTYWWQTDTSPVTFVYSSPSEAIERFKEEGGTDYTLELESLTGAYDAPGKGYKILLSSQFTTQPGSVQ
jgi:hypothetical protein